jgi:photosystem II stability/assembly factor-like uncharacterized protein
VDSRHLSSWKWRWVAIGCSLAPAIATAHSPHHVISDLATAAVTETEAETFILITDQVFRSDEQGASWKNLVNGLNNQYAFTDVEMSPDYASDGVVFLASSGDGVYRSSNHGESWLKINSGLGRTDIRSLSVSADFASDQRVLAAASSGGAWRSTDGGDSWHLVLTENVMIGEFAEATGRQEPNVVYAGDADGNIWRSDDNGKLWEIISTLPDAGSITSIAAMNGKILVGTEKAGLHRLTIDETATERLRLPVSEEQVRCRDSGQDGSTSDNHITSVTFEPLSETRRRLLVTTWYGALFVSDDGGATWATWRTGLSCDSQANRMSQAHFSGAAITRFENGKKIYWLGAFDGLFRSTYPFSSWKQRETLPLGLIKGMAVTGGRDLAAEVAVSTYGGGFYLVDVTSGDWVIGNKGLITTRLTGLGFSPSFGRDGVIYAGASRRLLRSSDRGHSWQPIELERPGFGRRVLNKLNSLGLSTDWLDSSEGHGRGPVYPTQLVALPGVDPGRVLIATRYHGLIMYDVAADSIERVWSDTSKVMYSLVISPQFERDKTIFSSIRGEGLFRSEDGGRSWLAVNTGLDFVEGWQQNRRRGDFRRDVQIAISPNFSDDGIVFAGSPAGNGLYVSRDRGSSWSRIDSEFGASPSPILVISVSPNFKTDGSLTISVKGRGLFRSTDGGKSFVSNGGHLIDANASIEYLEYSPAFETDRTVIAASDEGLFVSIDEGLTWQSMARPVRYEDMRNVVRFGDGWQRKSGPQFSASTETVTSGRDGLVTVDFVGSGIRWIGSRGPDYGVAQVYIDNKLVETVACKAASVERLSEVFTIQGLPFGPHTIEVRVNPGEDSVGHGKVAVDAFDVLP